MKRQRISSVEILRRAPLILLGGLALYFSILTAWALGYQLVYAGRIFPGVSVAGVALSGMQPGEAAAKLSQTLSYPITGKVIFRSPEQMWVASPSELGMVFDPTASANAAYAFGRAGNPFKALWRQAQAQGLGADVPPVVIFDQRVAYRYLQILAQEIDQPQVEAKLELEGANVVAHSGQVGRLLNLDATMIYLGAQLQTFRDGESPLVIGEATPQLLDVSSQAEMARKILSQPLTLLLPNMRAGDPGPWVYDVPFLAEMIGVSMTESNGKAELQVGINPSSLRMILSELKATIDREPQNARFVFNDQSAQIEPILASQTGRALDVEASLAAINAALLRGEHRAELVVYETQPNVADTASGAELGITQLVAQHTTYFYGSSAERIQNIAVAAERYHGALVAPNETFSMGKYLDDVSLENGFAEALIIYGGRTIKGVGGGVCQVSTTLFRTVFFAGFPVVERYSHAYRVVYYEKTISGETDPALAGLDATVYFPLVDFKFLNDTPYWLLMETYVDVAARTITWKMYSTSDGRSVQWETTGPINPVPPTQPIFEENPELERDEIKQVDYAAQGADVTVTRTVWRGGQVYFNDEFQTHYQPWSAICQYGPGTENPEKKAKKQEICVSPN